MSELTQLTGGATSSIDDEPGTELALCVEPEGVLVCGNQSAVAKYIAELRGLATDALETADVSSTVLAHGAAAAAAGVSLAAQAGEFVRLSPATLQSLKTNHALPVGNGYFRGTLADAGGKFRHQVQWQRVDLVPTQLLSVQMLAMQVALATAIASVEESLARVEGKIERVLTLAEASRAGDVRGHFSVLSRLTGHLDNAQVLTNTDWESVASLGPDLVVTVERLREHIKRTLAGFDPTRAIQDRADYLRRAVEDNRLGESLHLLVISEQSLYLWQRLRIERVRSTEPDHLQMVLDDARTLLADNAEEDGALLQHAREHLADYARMDRLDGFRWGATHNLSHDIVQLRKDLDGFAEARGRQIAEWIDAERPSVSDAIAEVGSLAVSAGGAAAGVVGRALGTGLSGIGTGLGFMGRGVGNLVGLSQAQSAEVPVPVELPASPSPSATGTFGELHPLVKAGLLQPGETLSYHDASTDITHVAVVTAEGRVGYEGNKYDDPSTPLIRTMGLYRHGWRDWRRADGSSLRDLDRHGS